MNGMRKTGTLTGFLIVLLLMLNACSPAAGGENGELGGGTSPTSADALPQLTITWFAWPPCDALTRLVTSYPDAIVKVDCVPVGQWHDAIFNGFLAQGGSDLPILDDGFIGEAVEGNYVLDLTDFLQTNSNMNDWMPATLSAIGEYPEASGRYYAAPLMTDAMILVYNREILGQYGIEQPADTWEGLLRQAGDIKVAGMYDGFVWFWSNNGNQLQDAWNQLAWSWGGELWNPVTYQIAGIINSAENEAALNFARRLYLTGPESAGNYIYADVTAAMCEGTAAMTVIWSGVVFNWQNEAVCPQSANFGYAVPPAGPQAHVLSQGGMGISLSKYSTNPEAASAFLQWLFTPETQLEWVSLGGHSGYQSVQVSETAMNAAAFNPVYVEAYQLTRNTYNLPEAYELLTLEGEYLHQAIVGEISPRDALKQLGEAQQAVISREYNLGPPTR